MSDASSARVTGRVKFFDSRRGFGFILPDDGSKDVFISLNFLPKGVTALDPDQKMAFVVETGKKGIFAKDVELL